MAFTNVNCINGYIIRRLHDMKGNKTFGYISGKPVIDITTSTLIFYQGNLIDVQQHETKDDAMNARAIWSVVDRVNGWTIRKGTSGNRPFITDAVRYDDAGNIVERFSFITLTHARKFCGANAAPSIPTAPKSSYPQNQKGYYPPSNR